VFSTVGLAQSAQMDADLQRMLLAALVMSSKARSRAV
jgi:hypothetical protein